MTHADPKPPRVGRRRILPSPNAERHLRPVAYKWLVTEPAIRMEHVPNAVDSLLQLLDAVAAEAEARGRVGADEELRQARIAREADDLAWRKRWEKAEARAAEGVLVVASLLKTQEYGHRRDDAINGTCRCRWCRAHRLVPDSMSGEAEKKGGG